MVVLPPQARAGFFGKLPARGDFVRENLPRDFTDAWDGWWQRGMADTQARFGEDWREAWLEAPVWRFVLPPGLCGAAGVLGLWMPSVDRAGRMPSNIETMAARNSAERRPGDKWPICGQSPTPAGPMARKRRLDSPWCGSVVGP